MSPATRDRSPVLADQADRLGADAWKVVGVAAIGSFMAQLDATVVNVSLAPLAADQHVTLAAIQWVTSGYLLALALTLPLSGWLVDRVGARTLYLGCFAAFTVSSTSCGLAWSVDSLIVLRILQGTTAMDIVQRPGGQTLTTLCAVFLGWRLSSLPAAASTSNAFTAAFGLLCALHAWLFLATLRLPWRMTQAVTAPRAA